MSKSKYIENYKPYVHAVTGKKMYSGSIEVTDGETYKTGISLSGRSKREVQNVLKQWKEKDKARRSQNNLTSPTLS